MEYCRIWLRRLEDGELWTTKHSACLHAGNESDLLDHRTLSHWGAEQEHFQHQQASLAWSLVIIFISVTRSRMFLFFLFYYFHCCFSFLPRRPAYTLEPCDLVSVHQPKPQKDCNRSRGQLFFVLLLFYISQPALVYISS